MPVWYLGDKNASHSDLISYKCWGNKDGKVSYLETEISEASTTMNRLMLLFDSRMQYANNAKPTDLTPRSQ